MVAFRMEKAVPELRNWTLPKWAQNPFSRPWSLFKQGALLMEKNLFSTHLEQHILGFLEHSGEVTLCVPIPSHFAPHSL